MSFNSMKDLSCNMTLGDITAKNITCSTITVLSDDPDDPTRHGFLEISLSS